MRKIPAGSECANILVGQVDFLDEPIVAFARLAKPAILADLTEVRLTRIHAHHTYTHTHILADLTEERLARIHTPCIHARTFTFSGGSTDLDAHGCKHAHYIIFEEVN